MSKANAQPFISMTKGTFAYLCQVPEEGYRWDTDLSSVPGQMPKPGKEENLGTPWLVAGELGAEGFVRQYAPFQAHDLHHRFGKLSTTLKTVHQFASKYGWLGHQVALYYPDRGPQSVQLGESFQFWKREIESMRDLLQLWNLIQQKQIGELANHVFWRREPTRVFLRWNERLINIATASHRRDDELLVRWHEGDIIEPARYYLCEQINHRMTGHVSPTVLPFHEGQIFMFPDCLCSALYVLFALEVSGRIHPAIMCRGCGNYFVPTHGSQVYHDSACRKLAWYHRKHKK